MDKLVFNCETGEMEEVAFTPEEIAQREHEASLPPVIPEPTEIEILRVEHAQSNVEMIDLIMAMLGGV